MYTRVRQPVAMAALAFFACAIGCIAVAGGCRSVRASDAAEPPRNTCAASGCAEYGPDARCEAERCIVDGPPSFVLAVHLPEVSLFAPESTFLLTKADIARLTRPTNSCPTGCVVLPQLAQVEGSYVVAADVRDRFSAALELAGGPVVPATLRLRPLFASPTQSDAALDAVRLGLPVTTVVAERLFFEQAVDGRTQRAVSYRALVPPLNYEFQIAPDLVVRSVPPVTLTRPITQRRDLAVIALPIEITTRLPFALDRSETRTTTITSSGRSLAGFRAEIVEPESSRVLSATATLAAAGGSVVLESVTLTNLNSSAAEIWLTPPASALAVPSMHLPIIAGLLPNPITYPRLGAPVSISGTVVGALGVGARLQFRSRSIESSDPLAAEFLRYETVVATDDSGRFSTVLPRGAYVVDAQPLRASDEVARTSVEVNLAAASDSLRITLPATTIVQGSAGTRDGVALSDASVEFLPCGTLRAPDARAVRNPPRARAVVTNLLGEYVLAVDPGLYDVVITPQLSSGFAPIVVHDVNVPALASGTTLRVRALEVGPPALVPLRFRDPADNPIVPTLMRLYVQRPGLNSYIEVGRALSGDDGRVELLHGTPRNASALLPILSTDAGVDGALP